MHVVRLTAENILRLVAVDITPEGSTVVIGGKNRAGKSSVLNAIAMALGGEKLAPAEPIRQGETKATIRLDLGEYVVTRTFTRTRRACTCGSIEGIAHLPSCDGHQFSPTTNSYLTVTTKDGAKYPSPQALLNKMLGSLTFDPFAFANTDDAKSQARTLAALVGYDTTAIDGDITDCFDSRTIIGRELDLVRKQLTGRTEHPGVGTEPITAADVAEMLEGAAHLQRQADAASGKANAIEAALSKYEDRRADLRTRCGSLETQIAKLQSDHAETLDALVSENARITSATTDLENAHRIAVAAHAAVPPTDALRARLVEVEAHNAKAAENTSILELRSRLARVEKNHADAEIAVEAARAEKARQIAALTFPVDGLSMVDEVITFHGIPFAQASTAERLAVSVAVGLAMHPTLRVMLIRDGSLMDDDTMALVARLADEHGAQVWIERVARPGDPVSVMIADGAEVKL